MCEIAIRFDHAGSGSPALTQEPDLFHARWIRIPCTPRCTPVPSLRPAAGVGKFLWGDGDEFFGCWRDPSHAWGGDREAAMPREMVEMRRPFLPAKQSALPASAAKQAASPASAEVLDESATRRPVWNSKQASWGSHSRRDLVGGSDAGSGWDLVGGSDAGSGWDLAGDLMGVRWGSGRGI